MAAEVGSCLLFNSHLSKPVAFQQSSVPKLLVASLQSLLVMLDPTVRLAGWLDLSDLGLALQEYHDRFDFIICLLKN